MHVKDFRIFALILIVFQRTLSAGVTVTVNTAVGKIRGYGNPIKHNEQLGNCFQFLGIPYGKQPERFRKPQPYGSFQGVFDAHSFGKHCEQGMKYDIPGFNFETSENCLKLNIFIPQSVSKSNKYGVLVWISASGYTFGGSSEEKVEILAMHGKIIVVTFNHRLGVHGFLSTGDSASPGNYGLWDQKLAIEWVRANIESFGGDPSKITLGGYSSGGESASFQAIMPQNKGLFQRVICQSSVATSNSSISSSLSPFNDIFFNKIDCIKKSSSIKIVNCLKTKSADEILKAATLTFAELAMRITDIPFSSLLGPVVDGDFIPDIPVRLLRDPKSPQRSMLRSVDFLAGNTNGEGSLLSGMITPSTEAKWNMSKLEGVTTSFMCDGMAGPLTNTQYRDIETIKQAICDKYRVEGGNTDNRFNQSVRATHLFGDALNVAPVMATLDIHSEDNFETKTYQYLFTRLHPVAARYKEVQWAHGVSHGMESTYLFSVFQFPYMNSQDDIDVSRNMIKLWTNFIKSGDPNDESISVKWPQYNSKTRPYIIIDTTLSASTDLFADRMSLWLQEIPRLLYESLTTTPSPTTTTTTTTPAPTTTSRTITTTSNPKMTTSQKNSVPTQGDINPNGSEAKKTSSYTILLSLLFFCVLKL